MQVPLEITYKDTEHSAAINAYIKTRAQKLESYYQGIISCHAVIEHTNKQQTNPAIHSIKLHLTLPNKIELTAHIENSDNLYKAIHACFDKVQRQMIDHVNIMEGATKSHDELHHGTVVRLFEEDGFGFIEATDGSEYYFNQHSLTPKSKQHLQIGAQVHFIEYMGDEGPQAHKVKVLHERGKKER